MSSDSTDRGWNIVLGKARSAIVASLLGRSRSDESSLLGDILIGALFILLFLFILEQAGLV